jgi:anti-anti-sigma factor
VTSHFLQSESVGRVTTVQLTKDAEYLGSENASAVAEELFGLVGEANGSELLLDLQNVRYMTSTGLTVLLALRGKLHAAGGRLSLCNPSPQVVEVLDVTRLNTLFEVHPSSNLFEHAAGCG